MDNELILKPEEVVQRRSQSNVTKIQFEEEPKEQLINTAGLVRIDYESQGRFATPPTLYFDDFLGKHLNDIELSTQENLLENLIIILNDLKKNEPDFDVRNMTAEDLLETLIALKQQFEGDTHIHYWICDCQVDKSDKERIINEHTLSLGGLSFKSMSQIDEEMKVYMTERFKDMSDEEFKAYLLKKYKNNPLDDIDSYTREQEISTILIKEPFHIIAGNDVYTIRYPRLDDVIKAKKFAEKLYSPKIKNIQNRKEHGVPLHELKDKKENEIKALKDEQASTIVLYAKSMMLVSKNGMILADNDKYEMFKNEIKRNTIRNIEDLFDNIQFGLQTEAELSCPICGETEKRLLRDFLDPRQLLPFNHKRTSNGDAPERELRLNPGFDLYFGI